jgi:hypothetical protein
MKLMKVTPRRLKRGFKERKQGFRGPNARQEKDGGPLGREAGLPSLCDWINELAREQNGVDHLNDAVRLVYVPDR